jgi:hypothetical protein
MCKLEHHRWIASLLEQLSGELLLRHHCLFGGGTAIALRHGEFRQSVDVELLVCNRQGYRELRQLIRRHDSLVPLWKDPRHPPPRRAASRSQTSTASARALWWLEWPSSWRSCSRAGSAWSRPARRIRYAA